MPEMPHHRAEGSRRSGRNALGLFPLFAIRVVSIEISIEESCVLVHHARLLKSEGYSKV